MKYNSLEDFLIQNGSSWDEFIRENKRTRTYNIFDEERSVDSRGIISRVYLKYEHPDGSSADKYGLLDFFNRTIMWAETVKGNTFWSIMDTKFNKFLRDENIEEMPLRYNKLKRQIQDEMDTVVFDEQPIDTFEEDMI